VPFQTKRTKGIKIALMLKNSSYWGGKKVCGPEEKREPGRGRAHRDTRPESGPTLTSRVLLLPQKSPFRPKEKKGQPKTGSWPSGGRGEVADPDQKKGPSYIEGETLRSSYQGGGQTPIPQRRRQGTRCPIITDLKSLGLN